MKITKETISKLDSLIGVYIFKNKQKVLYIGKSINIKARLLSHLENAKKDYKEKLIIEKSTSIQIKKTTNEFNALLLESDLIKRYKPPYNVRWKDNKSYLYIKISNDNSPKIFITRKENDNNSVYFGPFSSVKNTENIIKNIRRIFPFCTDKTISLKGCFYSKLGLCNPCPNNIEKIKNRSEKNKLKKIYRKNIYYIKKILEGKNKKVERYLLKKILDLSKVKKYEEALIFRNKLFNFQKLLHQQINSNEYGTFTNPKKTLTSLTNYLKSFYQNIKLIKRIECYDISNLSFKDSTGSMVVSENGILTKNQYRKFKIKSIMFKSDVQMLQEVLFRRFKNKWKLPDLIIVDGGTPQIISTLNVLKKIKINIPILGIAKRPNRVIVGSKGLPTIKFESDNPVFNLIILLRDESHRFAKNYHLHIRNSKFLN